MPAPDLRAVTLKHDLLLSSLRRIQRNVVLTSHLRLERSHELLTRAVERLETTERLLSNRVASKNAS